MSRVRRSLLECLDDERERAFVVAALGLTLTDEQRARYADTLESLDPERAEWLRLEAELHARAAADPATRGRFEALSEALTGDWVRLLTRDTLLNCGKARGEPRRVRFALVCERRWESLAPTEDPRARGCDACQERVYHCDTLRDAELHARAGHCIAVPGALVASASEHAARNMLGRPDPAELWASRLFSDDREG